MDNLLQKIDLKLSSKWIPFMVTVPVHDSGGPFLVTGTKSWVWVEKVVGGVLKSAVRAEKLPVSLSEDLVQEIARVGLERKWGNNFSYTLEGLNEARKYVQYYGIEDTEVLLSEKDRDFPAPKNVKLSPVSWMPKGRAIVVPADRSFLGLVGAIKGTHWTAIVHNPSRGLAVLGDW